MKPVKQVKQFPSENFPATILCNIKYKMQYTVPYFPPFFLSYHDRSAGVLHLLSTHKALSSLHGNGAHGVLSQVLGNLQDKSGGTSGHGHLEGVQDRRKGSVELREKGNKIRGRQ